MRNARRQGDGREQPSLLLKLLDPLTWFCSQDWIWQRAPRWLNALCQRYLNWFIGQTLVVRMQQTELRGTGCADTWMAPGTETTAVMEWFEQQVLDGPRAEIAAFDYIECVVFHCSADERAAVARDNVSSDTHLVGLWQGWRRDWWSDGAAAIAGLVPGDHNGLYLFTKRVIDLYRAAISE
jgi:hypothetical protein